MTTGRHNPYSGLTRHTLRPSPDQSRYRPLTERALEAAQALWDAAEHERKLEDRVKAQGKAIADAQVAAEDYSRVTRDDVMEEHAGKALENRLRVAFLSRRGAKVSEWNEQRASIIAKYFSDQDANPPDREPRGFSRGF